MNYEFNIRALQQDDWKALKHIRLQALRLNTRVFGSGYDDEKDFTRTQWQDLLDGQNKIIAGCLRGNTLIGIAAAHPHKKDETGKSAILGMWYLQSEWRGRGLLEAVVQKTIDWSLAQPQFDLIKVYHRASNNAPRKMIQKFGFECVGQKPRGWPDGTIENEYIYHRKIER